jgi:hypothetical protein
MGSIWDTDCYQSVPVLGRPPSNTLQTNVILMKFAEIHRSSVLQYLMQHLSPRVCTVLGSQARLYINEHHWAGSTFRWFDIWKCYNEVVDGLD